MVPSEVHFKRAFPVAASHRFFGPAKSDNARLPFAPYLEVHLPRAGLPSPFDDKETVLRSARLGIFEHMWITEINLVSGSSSLALSLCLRLLLPFFARDFHRVIKPVVHDVLRRLLDANAEGAPLEREAMRAASEGERQRHFKVNSSIPPTNLSLHSLTV